MGGLHKLVIVGRRDETSEQTKRLICTLSIERQVLIVEDAPHEDALFLSKRAEFFVLYQETKALRWFF